MDDPVDIIVRARDGHDLTSACLASIRRNTPEGTYRLILVDDGSQVAYQAHDCDFLCRSAQSRGAVSATNTGLALSLLLPGEYVVVLDNDTRVPEGDRRWLERFVREIESDEGCACVGATTSFANPPQHILAVPQTYTADWERGKRENPAAPWFVSFACLLRKTAVRQVGLWDERYNPGNFEDTDYSVALRRAGWSVKVARSVYIHHEGHKTFGSALKELLRENRGKFIAKWGPGGLWDLGLVSDAEVGALLRARSKA